MTTGEFTEHFYDNLKIYLKMTFFDHLLDVLKQQRDSQTGLLS